MGYTLFGLLFSEPMYTHCFSGFRKKVLDPKWTIYKHVSDKSKKNMSVVNFGIRNCVVFESLFGQVENIEQTFTNCMLRQKYINENEK